MHRMTNGKSFAVSELGGILRNEPFQFSLRGAKGDAAAFFGPTPRGEAVLNERKHWLMGTEAAFYCGVLPAAKPAISELCRRARQWSPGFEVSPEAPLLERCRAVGLRLEPDFLVVERSATGVFHAVAGAVCFPSHWDFQRVLGSRLDEIHGVVPGLNAAVGRKIDALLERLPPGETWERSNWGISRSCELNQHPSRDVTRLGAGEAVAEAWLRIELQALLRLSDSPSVLFGIRPCSISLAEVRRDPAAREALMVQLETMPELMREYKGVSGCLAALLAFLREPQK